MSSQYVQILDLKIQKISVKTYKIDGSALKTFKIIIANFQIEHKVGRFKYFSEIFLIANIKIKVVLKMLFFKFSIVNMPFSNKTLT